MKDQPKAKSSGRARSTLGRSDSGTSLGEVLTACIELGLDRVRARLLATGTASAPTPKVGGGLDEIFRSIKLLSVGLPSTSSK